jgi:Zn-dependent protease with chaperone function
MYPSALLLNPVATGKWPYLMALLALVLYLGGVSLLKADTIRQPWLPDLPIQAAYEWHYVPCPGCVSLAPPRAWQRMSELAGVPDVNFLSAPGERWGPAYSFPPNAVAISPQALKLSPCQLNFLVGHELVHIAQRHFDEDASAAAVLSGLSPSWTRSGKRALSLLDGNFSLALKMSPMWQQQEREADWVGAMLSAQASGCSLQDGALSYLDADSGYGGGLGAAHEDSAERVRHLQGFAEPAARLAERRG